jgi:8-oxo-dGTP diphosphatase
MAADPGPAPSRRITDVAVGVVFRGDGAVLIGQRLAGKPYAGWWEFPGGKFESGEDAAQALARELDEELGIRVRESHAWVVREHVYEHAHVRLHFRRVVRWDGEPVSREGQALVWCPPAAIDVGPLLPAALAPIAWLGLPQEYAISNAAELGSEAFLARLAGRLHGGPDSLRLLQLREPDLSPGDFAALFPRVVDLARAAGARLLVNSRHEPRCWEAAAQRTGGGVHLTGRDLASLARDGKRPDLPLVGASCHQPADLDLAGRFGVDLAVFGPVKSTASHPAAAPMGWPTWRHAVALTPVPVYALGGLERSDRDEAMRHGAHGVALQRKAWRG